MSERVIVFALTTAAVLAVGARDWKQAAKKDRVVLVLILVFACYTGFGYMADKALPNVHSAAAHLFGPVSKRIDAYLKPPPPKTP
ncbi:MAG: hypothetical protein K0Q59_3538, partial [Paenibacillus sp.]|nr:hypothetical protein [Paenibacillus sp.]